MRTAREPVIVSKGYTVTLTISRTDRVAYPSGEYGDGLAPPIEERHEELTVTSSQDDLARAVDIAIAMLKLQHPDGE